MLAIAVLGIFSVVATAVSSSEVHPSLDVKANTTQVNEIQATKLDMEAALRETTGFNKELEVSTRENITNLKASKISSDLFHQQAELETQVANRPENTVKRVDDESVRTSEQTAITFELKESIRITMVKMARLNN